MLLLQPISRAEAPLETFKVVKLGKKNIELHYEKDPSTRKLRRLTVTNAGMRDVYEDTNGLGYFDSRLVLTKKSEVHFFNLYHGRYQNIELSRTGKLGILNLTLFFNERSGQYENLLKKYIKFKKMADNSEADLAANCTKKIVQQINTVDPSQLMVAAESQGLGEKLFSPSCKTGKFAPYYDDLVKAIAKITKTDKETNSQTFLACLQNHKMGDVAEIIRGHLNNPIESNFQKIECKDKSDSLGEFIEEKTDANKKTVAAHIEMYVTPPLPKVNYVDEYASILFHENLHAAGIISESRTRSIENCCNGSIPNHDANCRAMDEVTDQNHKVVVYGSAMQSLNGFPEIWRKLRFGREDNVAENMFASFSDYFQKLDDKSLVKVEVCLSKLGSGEKASCLPGFAKVCERYSESNQKADCNIEANDLAILFQKNMEKNCAAEKNGKSCLANVLDKANTIYASSLPDAKESFTNLALLQNRSPELVSANFNYQLKTLDPSNFGKLTASMKDQGEGSIDSANNSFANFLRNQEELPGAQAAYESCIGKRGKNLSKETVSACLTADTNRLGASGAYQTCKKESGMSDSECTMISLGILKTELNMFVGNDKSIVNSSECEKSITGGTPADACRVYLESFQNLIHNSWVNCHIAGSNNPSFQCLNNLVSGVITQEAQAEIAQQLKLSKMPNVTDGASDEEASAVRARNSYVSSMDAAFPSISAFYKKSIDSEDREPWMKMMSNYFHGIKGWSTNVLESYVSCGRDGKSSDTSCLQNMQKSIQSNSVKFFHDECPKFYLGKDKVGNESLTRTQYCDKLGADFLSTLDHDAHASGQAGLSLYRDMLICGDFNFRFNFDAKMSKDFVGDISTKNCNSKDTSAVFLDPPSTSVATEYAQSKMDAIPGAVTSTDAKASNIQIRNAMVPSQIVLPIPTPTDVGEVSRIPTGSVAVNPDSMSDNRDAAINIINQASKVSVLADKAVANVVNTVVDAVVPAAYAADEKSALGHDNNLPTTFSSSSAYVGGLAPTTRSSSRGSHSSNATNDDDDSSSAYASPASRGPQTPDPASNSRRADSQQLNQINQNDSANTNSPQQLDSREQSHVNGITPSSSNTSTGSSTYVRNPGIGNLGKSGASQESSAKSGDSGADPISPAQRNVSKKTAAAHGGTASTDAGGVGLSPGSKNSGAGSLAAKGAASARSPTSADAGKTYSLDEIVKMATADPAKFSDMLDDKKFIDNLNQKEVLVMFKNHSLGTLSAKVVISFDAASNKYSVRRIGDSQ